MRNPAALGQMGNRSRSPFVTCDHARPSGACSETPEAQAGWLPQGLEYDAIALGQAEQAIELLPTRIAVELDD
jgi:hypothetical protein